MIRAWHTWMVLAFALSACGSPPAVSTDPVSRTAMPAAPRGRTPEPVQGSVTVREESRSNPFDDDEFPLGTNVATALIIASALVEEGDLASAVPYYQFAYEQDPTNVEVALRYSTAALHVGQVDKALMVLEGVAQEYPSDVDVGLQRGRILAALGRMDEAAAVNRDLLAIYPLNDDLRVQRVTLVEDNAPLEAAALLEDMLATDPDPALRTHRATLLARGGDSQSAEAEALAALAVDPTLEPAAELLTEIYKAQGREDEVVGLLESLVERTPGREEQRMGLADAYLGAGRAADAVALLLPLAQGGQLDWGAQLLLVDLLGTLGRSDDAWPLVTAMIDQGADGPLVNRVAGEIALDRGDEEVAQRYLEKAIEGDPHDVDSVISLLVLMTRQHPDLFREEPAAGADVQGRFDELLARAGALADESSVRHNYLVGAMLRRLERDSEALPHLVAAHGLAPGNADILYDLAVSQEATGAYRDAAASLEDLLKLRPEDADVLNFYGYLLADQGWELARAETMILQALEQEPENAFYLDSLGWVYYRQGKYDDALDKLISASNGMGDDPVVLEHIGDTLDKLGQYERALSIYERARDAGGDPAELEARLQAIRKKLREAP